MKPWVQSPGKNEERERERERIFLKPEIFMTYWVRS
jgi:hypothetical protein